MEDKNFKTALSIFIKSIEAGTKYHEYYLDLGITPPVLQRLDIPALPMAISVKMLDKCYFDHGVSETTLGRLYDLIANPTAVFKSDSPHLDHAVVDAVVLVTIESKGGAPLLIAIHVGKSIGRRTVNLVKSVYEKPEAVVMKWREKGLLLWHKPTAPRVESTVTAIKATTPVPQITVKKARQFAKN